MVTRLNRHYQSRMDQTLNDKIAALSAHVNPGDRVLDVGCGQALDLMQWVVAQGAQYEAIDKAQHVIDFMTEHGVTVHSSVDGLTDTYDVIYLSSVVHELFSYLSPLEVAHVFNRLVAHLSVGGTLIIRDWYIHTASWANERSSLAVEGSEVAQWVTALQTNGVIGQVQIDEGVIHGSQRDMYEVAYHAVWGLQSLPYEVLDRHLHQLQLVERTDQTNMSYTMHLGKQFRNVVQILGRFTTKTILVYAKGEGS